MLVRVYDDCISFRRREFVTDRILGDDWLVPLPSVEPRPFAFAGRAAACKDPGFDGSASLSVAKIRAKNRGGSIKNGKSRITVASVEKDAIKLEFPQATAVRGERPIEYELTFKPSAGEPTVRHVLANGFNQPSTDPRASERQTCTIALDRLPAAPFDVEVRAVSSLGRKSAALAGRFEG